MVVETRDGEQGLFEIFTVEDIRKGTSRFGNSRNILHRDPKLNPGSSSIITQGLLLTHCYVDGLPGTRNWCQIIRLSDKKTSLFEFPEPTENSYSLRFLNAKYFPRTRRLYTVCKVETQILEIVVWVVEPNSLGTMVEKSYKKRLDVRGGKGDYSEDWRAGFRSFGN